VNPTLDPRVTASFRRLDLTLPSIEANLALDEALLLAAEERGSGPVLRTWEFPRLAVVMGASCRLHDDIDVGRCQSDNIPIARRSSGGGTVLVGPGALNVTIVLPADAAPGLAAVDTTQAFVLGRIAEGLRAAGCAVEVRGSGDLTLGDRKFAGSAQRRLRRHFLVHASLLYDFPLAAISTYTRVPKRQPAYRAGRSHQHFLTNLPLPRPRLLDAVCSVWLPPDPAAPPDVPADLVDDLIRSKFADPGWVTRL
jgi:lipoate---protein ligase